MLPEKQFIPDHLLDSSQDNRRYVRQEQDASVSRQNPILEKHLNTQSIDIGKNKAEELKRANDMQAYFKEKIYAEAQSIRVAEISKRVERERRVETAPRLQPESSQFARSQERSYRAEPLKNGPQPSYNTQIELRSSKSQSGLNQLVRRNQATSVNLSKAKGGLKQTRTARILKRDVSKKTAHKKPEKILTRKNFRVDKSKEKLRSVKEGLIVKKVSLKAEAIKNVESLQAKPKSIVRKAFNKAKVFAEKIKKVLFLKTAAPSSFVSRSKNFVKQKLQVVKIQLQSLRVRLIKQRRQLLIKARNLFNLLLRKRLDKNQVKIRMSKSKLKTLTAKGAVLREKIKQNRSGKLKIENILSKQELSLLKGVIKKLIALSPKESRLQMARRITKAIRSRNLKLLRKYLGILSLRYHLIAKQLSKDELAFFLSLTANGKKRRKRLDISGQHLAEIHTD